MELLALTIIGIISGVSCIVGMIISSSIMYKKIESLKSENHKLAEYNSRLSDENLELHSKLLIKILGEDAEADDDDFGFCPDPDCCPPEAQSGMANFDTLPRGITRRKNGGFSVRIQRNGRRKSRVCKTLEEAKRVRENILRSLR